jgi:DNA-directed RNA polymerase specialized sigma24 family protein
MEVVGPDPVAEVPPIALADADRLGALYERHAGDAFRFAYLLCGDRDIAADVVQDAFERVMTRFGSLRREEAFRAPETTSAHRRHPTLLPDGASVTRLRSA